MALCINCCCTNENKIKDYGAVQLCDECADAMKIYNAKSETVKKCKYNIFTILIKFINKVFKGE